MATTRVLVAPVHRTGSMERNRHQSMQDVRYGSTVNPQSAVRNVGLAARFGQAVVIGDERGMVQARTWVGSTLLTRVLNAADGFSALSEPDICTQCGSTPIVCIHVSARSVQCVIDRFVRRRPKAWPPCV